MAERVRAAGHAPAVDRSAAVDIGRRAELGLLACCVGADSQSCWTRRRRGQGLVYLDEHGDRITDSAQVQRLRDLLVPPAWQELWLGPHPNGHLQAVGTDDRGRSKSSTSSGAVVAVVRSSWPGAPDGPGRTWSAPTSTHTSSASYVDSAAGEQAPAEDEAVERAVVRLLRSAK